MTLDRWWLLRHHFKVTKSVLVCGLITLCQMQDFEVTKLHVVLTFSSTFVDHLFDRLKILLAKCLAKQPFAWLSCLMPLSAFVTCCNSIAVFANRIPPLPMLFLQLPSGQLVPISLPVQGASSNRESSNIVSESGSTNSVIATDSPRSTSLPLVQTTVSCVTETTISRPSIISSSAQKPKMIFNSSFQRLTGNSSPVASFGIASTTREVRDGHSICVFLSCWHVTTLVIIFEYLGWNVMVVP